MEPGDGPWAEKDHCAHEGAIKEAEPVWAFGIILHKPVWLTAAGVVEVYELNIPIAFAVRVGHQYGGC